MSTPPKPLKWYRGLAEKRDRLQAGAFAVEGERAIRQIIASRPEAVTEILTTGESLPEYRRYPVRRISESHFGYISHTRTPQGVMAVVRLPGDKHDRLDSHR